MRCQRHGLAAGPNGQCVVCLREIRERATRRALFWGLTFIAGTIAACAVLLAPRLLSRSTVAHREPVVMNFAARAAESANPDLNSASNTPNSVGDTPPADSHATTPVNAPSASANAAASAAPSSSAAIAPATSADAVDAGRVPSREEITAALHATPVLMFSTGWCPVCARARAFFQQNGIHIVDRNVEADPQADAELKRRSGGSAIPLIEVDGTQLSPGFSEPATMQAVLASVERRLAVTGLQLIPERGTAAGK